MSNVFPTKLRILGSNWQVKCVPWAEGSNQATLGLADHDSLKITLTMKSVEVAKKTLLHELIHVAENAAKMELEEEDVERLENMLWAIFKDNPKLARFIFE